MIYESLFEKQKKKTIKAALIGTGEYGTSLLAQIPFIQRLEVPVICDKDPEALRRTCREAGIPNERSVHCSSRTEAVKALEKGKYALIEDGSIVPELPIDVIIECTGEPEDGAYYCQLGIKNGKHVAVVNKEMDSVIGPYLGHIAAQNGVVYTPADGDQPSLLIGLISWARSIGLEVVCGGKSLEQDAIFDERTGEVTFGRSKTTLSKSDMDVLRRIGPDDSHQIVQERKEILAPIRRVAPGTLCESVIAANAAAMTVDTPFLHAPFVRTSEIPQVFCTREEGGILQKTGVIDTVFCLRRDDDVSFAGGIYIVVRCDNQYVRTYLQKKGHIFNHNGSCLALIRPYHLLGAETPISVLCAGLLNIPTGGTDYKPRVDLVGQTVTELRAGSNVEIHHVRGSKILEALIVPSSPISDDTPIPFYLAAGKKLKVDVPAGTILTYGMVERPSDSILWDLREQQDKVLLSTQ
jgi:predicted homoserine dehydrogenase-like protein